MLSVRDKSTEKEDEIMNIGKYHTLELRYKQLNVQEIIVVVHPTFAVARRKPERKLRHVRDSSP